MVTENVRLGEREPENKTNNFGRSLIEGAAVNVDNDILWVMIG